jgi:hypothetical protein
MPIRPELAIVSMVVGQASSIHKRAATHQHCPRPVPPLPREALGFSSAPGILFQHLARCRRNLKTERENIKGLQWNDLLQTVPCQKIAL